MNLTIHTQDKHGRSRQLTC